MQTFGDLVTFNPHIHALVADGVFMPSGTFRVLPPLPADALAEALRHKVLTFLCAEGRLDPELAGRMLKWRHSGFSVHNQVRVKAGDATGRRCKANWARLIQKVYEIDPLQCSNCGGAMRIIALIDEPAGIKRILKHLKARDPGPDTIQPSGRDPPWPQGENLQLTYHPVSDIA